MAKRPDDSEPNLPHKKRRRVVESDSESGSDPDIPVDELLRMQNEEYLDFQDIVEVYGHQTDGLDEIWEDIPQDHVDSGTSGLCAICDDGGHLLLCDGPCMRAFHASKEWAKSSKCESLNLTEERIQMVESWYCLNCFHGQQQCFICGRLGRSKGGDKQVFVCDVALCGRFYHPECLVDWKADEKFSGIVDRAAFVKLVKEGKGFVCPAHCCRRCGESEEQGADNRIARCRRCPTAFHVNCFPGKISFEEEDDMPIRAWKIGRKLMIYCLKHDIDNHLSTPPRNHLKWPKVLSQNRKHQHMKEVPSRVPNYQRPTEASSRKQNHRNFSKAPSLNKTVQQLQEDHSLDRELDNRRSFVEERRPKFAEYKMEAASKFVKQGDRVPTMRPVLLKPPEPLRMSVLVPPKIIEEQVPEVVKIARSSQKTRMSSLMQQIAKSVTLEDVKKVLVEPSCYRENQEKNHGHRGEIISMLHAGEKALDILRHKGRLEDAKRLFSRDSLVRLLRIERSLGVYLAPFLHGIRYTSFGRHFTKVEKLNEIVNRINPYVDSGDMTRKGKDIESAEIWSLVRFSHNLLISDDTGDIRSPPEESKIVDFCCGANDFSVLLHKRLTATGKRCEFRNFDILPPRERFCFTQGDWLQNDGHDFLDGARLIMGLNPPFGVHASLADKFILHALKFRPKLLVLIAPPETMSSMERYKDFKYTLVWRDDQLLKGEAFFIPGSVGQTENENISQWNNVTPPLYLWSRDDMLQKHKRTAFSCRHVT